MQKLGTVLLGITFLILLATVMMPTNLTWGG